MIALPIYSWSAKRGLLVHAVLAKGGLGSHHIPTEKNINAMTHKGTIVGSEPVHA